MKNSYLLLAILAIVIWSMLRRAGGRQGPRIAAGSALFLVARWPVLVAWAVGTGGWLCLFLLAALAKGHDSAPELLGAVGMSLFLGLGTALFLVGIPFMVLRAFQRAPELALEPGEVVLQEITGNHVLGAESRGGKLLVTNRRIGFRPNRFNIQNTAWSMPLDDVRSIRIEGEVFLAIERASTGKPEWLVAANARGMAEQLDRIRQLPEAERR